MELKNYTFGKQDTWSALGNTTNAFYKGYANFTNMKSNSTVLCNVLNYVENVQNYDNYGIYLTTNLIIRVPKTVTTSGELVTWCQDNNVTVYYVLATPTTEEITDSYLLEQLNNILDIELYENLCYVDWVGIEKPSMTLQYAGTEDLGIKYIITEDGKKIRTDWRKLGRRKKWMMK